MKATQPIIAVVPVKETRAAKQRLAGVLSPSARQELTLAMLEDVLGAAAEVRSLAEIIVVTIDTAATQLAREYGATIATAGAKDGHTGAVTTAAAALAAKGAAMLTLPGDIPLVRASDIEAVIEAHRRSAGFTIVPARDEQGSNAILCSPANAVPLRFGEDSYFPHLAAARACGIEPVTVAVPRIALDIDRPDDLIALLGWPDETRGHAILRRHGISARSLAAVAS